MSGVIFLLIVGGWAAYLLPSALARYDQATRTRSIQRFSSAMRVLGRRTGEPQPAAPPPDAERRVRQAAARRAARRRRRTLLVLVGLSVVAAGVAGFGVLPWWVVAPPAGLVVAFLLVCRSQVRRDSDAYWTRAAQAEPAHLPQPRPTSPDDQPTVVIEPVEAARVAVAVQTADGTTLWDPVPVTLPTYVAKAKAPRTIRTIEIGEPARPAGAEEPAAADPTEPPAAAVNG